MTIEERLNFFSQHYDIIAEYHLEDKGKNVYIGESDKACRFCGKNVPEVTFKNESHAVPNFLGNKQLILKNECDACNTFFSNNLENYLDKYTKPYRTIAQIKGKTKIPNYKSKDQRSRYDVNCEHDQNKVSRIINPVDSNFAAIDIENKEIKTNFHLELYIPTAVYKCLVKIALSVMPEEELKLFQNALCWIMEVDHSKKICKPQMLLKAFIPGLRPNPAVTIIVLRGKLDNPVLPYCVFVMCFGNIAYQVLVPSDVDVLAGEQKEFTMKLIRFPLPFEKDWQFGVIQYSQDDMTSHEMVKDANVPITFGFDEAIEVDPSSIKLPLTLKAKNKT